MEHVCCIVFPYKINITYNCQNNFTFCNCCSTIGKVTINNPAPLSLHKLLLSFIICMYVHMFIQVYSNRVSIVINIYRAFKFPFLTQTHKWVSSAHAWTQPCTFFAFMHLSMDGDIKRRSFITDHMTREYFRDAKSWVSKISNETCANTTQSRPLVTSYRYTD